MSSLTSNASSLDPSVPGNPSSAPAPVLDITATVSLSVHSEKSDGPFQDSDNKLLPAADLTSEHTKGASSNAIAALMEEKEEKGYQVPVLETPSLLGQSLLHEELIPTSGPVRINAAHPGGGQPGLQNSKKLGYIVSLPQQIRRKERSCHRGRKHGRQHSEQSQRTQVPSLPATPVFVPVQPPLPPPNTLPLPPGVPAPQFSSQFPPGRLPPTGYSVPPPGFPPAPAKISTPWVSSGVQTAHSNAIPTTQAPPLSREEFYRVQRRLKEEEKKKFKIDEFTTDFAKELMEYKDMQEEHRHSFFRSKSPYSGSLYSRSSYTYSKSRSGSTGSSSYSPSFSCSHCHSYSRSPPYPRRGRGKSHSYRSRSRSHGYHRSRSRSPRYRGYHSRSRSPQVFREQSPTKCNVPQRKTECEYFNRYREVLPPYNIKATYGQSVNFREPFEKEHCQEWERKYREWYEKNYKGTSRKAHSKSAKEHQDAKPVKEEKVVKDCSKDIKSEKPATKDGKAKEPGKNKLLDSKGEKQKRKTEERV